MQLTMICTRVAGFADLEMMNTAQKKEDWNIKCTKTKNHVTN